MVHAWYERYGRSYDLYRWLGCNDNDVTDRYVCAGRHYSSSGRKLRQVFQLGQEYDCVECVPYAPAL